MALNTVHQYTPLSNMRHTRILIIHPAPYNSSMVCSLEAMDPLSTTPYNALSYSWAMDSDHDASLCRSITIDGYQKAITRNLFEALRRIRDGEIPIRLWADAVCINQDDDVERSTQVADMASIYAKAEATIVWLGENEDSENDQAEAALLRCLAAFARGAHTPDEHESHCWTGSDGKLNSLCGLKDPEKRQRLLAVDEKVPIENQPEKRIVWEGVSLLTRFSQRRWFRRRWVIQEVLFSNPTTSIFHFGPHTMSLVDFGIALRGLDWLLQVPGVESTLDAFEPGKADRVKRIRGVGERMLQMRNLATSLPFLLQMCGEYGCSDPRDRLYAIISLDRNCDLRADYTLSTKEIYTMFARRQTELGRADLMLCNARPERLESRELGLPSWVPDLRFKFDDFSTQSLHVKVLEGNVLCYPAWMYGTVRAIRSQGADTLLSISTDSPLSDVQVEIKEHDRHGLICPSDVLCSTELQAEGTMRSIHVLRRLEESHSGSEHFRLVRAFSDVSASMPDITTCYRIDVFLH